MEKNKELNFDDVKKIVTGCETKTEFHKEYNHIYRYAVKMGWKEKINEILPHKRKWTLETLKIEALKYKTKSDFMKFNMSAYNIALKTGHYDEIVKHMDKKNSKWTYEIVKEYYEKCVSLKQLRNEYGQNVISSTIRSGWHDELSKHFVKEPRSNIKWTKERVAKVAKKYKSRKEFGVNAPGAYQKALQMEWIDEISTHMKKGYTKWTKEKMIEIISGCETMLDIKKKSFPLYLYIIRHKMENTVFDTIKQ